MIVLKLYIYRIIFKIKFLFKEKVSQEILITKDDLAYSKINSTDFWSNAYSEIYEDVKNYDNYYI